jgi:hypothetical protein
MCVDPYAVSLPSMIVWQLIVATVHSFSHEWTTGTAETVQFHKAFYWCLEAVWISVWIYQETWNLLGMLWKSKVIACYSFHLQVEKCFSNLSLRWFPRNDQVFKNTPSSVHHWRDIPRKSSSVTSEHYIKQEIAGVNRLTFPAYSSCLTNQIKFYSRNMGPQVTFLISCLSLK